MITAVDTRVLFDVLLVDPTHGRPPPKRSGLACRGAARRPPSFSVLASNSPRVTDRSDSRTVDRDAHHTFTCNAEHPVTRCRGNDGAAGETSERRQHTDAFTEPVARQPYTLVGTPAKNNRRVQMAGDHVAVCDAVRVMAKAQRTDGGRLGHHLDPPRWRRIARVRIVVAANQCECNVRSPLSPRLEHFESRLDPTLAAVQKIAQEDDADCKRWMRPLKPCPGACRCRPAGVRR